jgi:hypothetical protein
MIEFYILQFLPGNLILVTTVSNNGSVSLFCMILSLSNTQSKILSYLLALKQDRLLSIAQTATFIDILKYFCIFHKTAVINYGSV